MNLDALRTLREYRAESQKEGIDMPEPSIELHAIVARLERVEKENRRPRSKPA